MRWRWRCATTATRLLRRQASHARAGDYLARVSQLARCCPLQVTWPELGRLRQAAGRPSRRALTKLLNRLLPPLCRRCQRLSPTTPSYSAKAPFLHVSSIKLLCSSVPYPRPSKHSIGRTLRTRKHVSAAPRASSLANLLRHTEFITTDCNNVRRL